MADADATTVCQFVGDPMPDIAGIGILVGFSGQAFLSLCLALWVFFFSRHGRLDMLHEDDSDEHEIEIKRLEMVQDILMIGNDIQVMMGIALMITVFSSYNKIDVYHFRLIYDIVSFVGVSVAAALVCFTFCVARKEVYHKRRQRRATGLTEDDPDLNEEDHDAALNHHYKQRSEQGLFFRTRPVRMLRRWVTRAGNIMPRLLQWDKTNPIIKKFAMSGRYRATYFSAALFLALTVMLNAKLSKWNLDTPGACYNTAHTSAPGAHHPQADRVYVWVTFGWMMSVMMFSVFDSVVHRRYILVAAFVQFPLHFYMMIALRTANQGLLGITAEQAAAKAAAAASGPEARRALTLMAKRAVRMFLARANEYRSSSTDATDIADTNAEDDNSENDWDFGQTTAVLLLSVAFIEALAKGREFFLFERSVKKKRRAIERRQARENRDEQDDRELAAFNTITNTNTVTNTDTNTSLGNMGPSRLRPWKHRLPTQTRTNSGSIAMVSTAASSSSTAQDDGSISRADTCDVEAAGPTDIIRH